MGKSRKNLMVGKWIPADRVSLLKWVKQEFDELKKTNANEYILLSSLTFLMPTVKRKYYQNLFKMQL